MLKLLCQLQHRDARPVLRERWPQPAYAAAQQCMQLDAEGLIPGIRRDIHFEEKQIRLEPGDIVFFYTGGVTEGMDPTGQQYGATRLQAFLLQHAADAPDRWLRRLWRS